MSFNPPLTDGTSVGNIQTRSVGLDGQDAKAESSPRANPTRTRTLLGLANSAPVVEEHQDLEHHDLVWSRIRLAWREPFAEFFGTFSGSFRSKPLPYLVMFWSCRIARDIYHSALTLLWQC